MMALSEDTEQSQQEKDTGSRWMRPLMASAAVAALLFIAACTANPTDDQSASRAGLEQFMEQELEFGSCDPTIVSSQPPVPQLIEAAEKADCATLEVPLDYENLDGEKIEIAVSRIVASGNDRLGSVVVNPGGPGSPSTTFAPLVAALWKGGPIAEQFDVVGFDPRGVGLSSPSVDCYTDEERDANRPLSAFGTWTKETTSAIVDKCAEGSGGEDMLEHLGTRDVARDMDVLRSALGDDKLNYAGVSYGSRLGTVYAEMFPDNVRALVLDGAVDPLQDTRGRQLQQAAGLQASFERFAEFCATQNSCPLGTAPAQATTAVQGLLRPLVEEPLLAADGRDVTFIAAGEGILSGLYSESQWPAIVNGLTELQAGRPDALLALRDGYYGRSDTGEYANNFEATFAINCVDEERLTEEEMIDLGNELNDVVPFLDPGTSPASRNGCADWPGEPTLGFPYATNIEGLPEVLVTSATGDPVTPHEGGISLAETLHARLLTVEANQHGTITSGIECVDEVVANYLVSLELPEEGASCSL
ncbi:alpha/beta hydrolase [Actinotalea sp. K2]|uniref:alpha/beta hydrolase n=1 Tax=Actinotalea sp. K2 TaxID=2939438 RepID=UPI002017488C|nr:alpha/beta hydrolase [Actinotalea sp. K2]MCL3863298.1 alpha/beta hydrolase [Actinotalea sp. K2]